MIGQENNPEISKPEKNRKKHICSSLVFVLNLTLLFLGYQVIKNQAESKKALKEESSESLVSIDSGVLDSQNQIATDRENKLRDLNSAPKSVKQDQITTNVTTKTTTPTSSTSTKKASTTTKTS